LVLKDYQENVWGISRLNAHGFVPPPSLGTTLSSALPLEAILDPREASDPVLAELLYQVRTEFPAEAWTARAYIEEIGGVLDD
jgi:hypothetical protein